MCLQDDVSVAGSELSMRHHQQKTRPLLQVGVIISRIRPFERGGFQREREERAGAYEPSGDPQRLIGDEESDADNNLNKQILDLSLSLLPLSAELHCILHSVIIICII